MESMTAPFRVSLSAYQAFQTCETRYFYQYVRRLRRKLRDIAPERGAIFHRYLESYYSSLQEGEKPSAAHKRGLATLLSHKQQMAEAASIAWINGSEELAQEYTGLIDILIEMADRYYLTRGFTDAQQYDVLLVELKLDFLLTAGIVSNSVIDLVLRHKGTGATWLTEHKTTKSIPESGIRIRDFQTVLYAKVLEATRQIHVDGILWNYIRTKEPTVPAVLKAGGVSKNKSCDTTWEVYERTVRAAGLNPADYEDMHEHLADREYTVFFPRFEHIIVTRPEILLEDYALTAQEMRRKSAEWARGVGKPIRTLSRNCSFCPFIRVCESTIVGGDPEDVIRRDFVGPKEGIIGSREATDSGTGSVGADAPASTNRPEGRTPRLVQTR